MAANMQQMAGAGQMMPQQLRRPQTSHQLQQMVYQNLLTNSQAANGLTWQGNVSLNDRMGKTMDLISNIALAINGIDHVRAAEFGCNFERDVFYKSLNKESYDQTMANKTLDFFKKRQANESNIQNTLNVNAQAQAAQQAQQAQAQAMMSMQAQMGRGMAQSQQGFQHLQHQMQNSQMAQQAHQQQPQMQQQQMGMGIGMGMGMGMVNQAGRGAMASNQQAMGMQNRQPQQFSNDISRLAPSDRAKVLDIASKMMAQASEEQKTATRLTLQQRLSPQQLAEFQSQGRDPLAWFFQNQAYQMLKNNASRLQQQQQQQAGVQNQGGGQVAAPAMMQQQQSQQSFQQRQNMMNANQTADFNPFTSNMESIKDQQLNGLMAQQAGQMVVPASSGGAQHATPQPGNQNIAGAQGQNQTPRQGQQQQQQQPQQQQQGTANLQQMKMNQAAQQSQNQMQLKMQQQNQPNGMPPAQSPGMNTLNTPVSRAPGGMNPMGGPGMGQGTVPFGDQRFNQGTQRPNNQAFSNMLANMTPEQRLSIQGLPPDKLNEVFRKWQSQRHEQMFNGGQMNQQQQNRPQNQFGGQMNPNLGAAGPQGMPINQQQQMQIPRMPIQNGQAQAMMDAMELPPHVQSLVGPLPVEIKTWRELKSWLSQNSSALPNATRGQLGNLQQRQFQGAMQKRAAGQNPNVNAAAMPNAGVQMSNQQQMAMQKQLGNIPAHVLHVTPQDLVNVRSQRANLAAVPDEQLRNMVMMMKKNSWQAQQQAQQQAQMRAQSMPGHPPPGQPQTPGQQQMGGQTPIQVQHTLQQPSRTTQSQTHASPTNMAQTASMQSAGHRPQQGQLNNQPRGSNQSQPAKSLKRPNTDDAADTSTMSNTGSTPRQASQPNQQLPKGVPTLTPQQLAGLSTEQRAKYEQLLKLQMAGQNQAANMMQQPNTQALNRLRVIGHEEGRQFSQEAMPDIPMSPQEHNETSAKLQRIAGDTNKVSRGLTKWYSITRDDARAKMFFRTRLRIMRQFSDGEPMKVLKDKFSINSAEIDQARAMLESMAKDLAANMYGRGMVKPGQQPQSGQGTTTPNQPAQSVISQQQQQTQQQNLQGQPAPLNAANLEKNTQALKNQQKSSGKGAQAPPAPTATQPPFPFGASSPHGNPSYIGKPKDINLQLPPARKKAKLSGQHPGQTPQSGATPSPKIAKNASPEMRRPEPPRPVFLCKEPDCDMAAIALPSEQALQSHVEEEHIKPREDPLKFVKENLALALGLEPDGTPKKVPKPAEGTTAMSTSASKQGQAPKNVAATPASHGNAMKRTSSGLSKGGDGKANKTNVDSKPRKTSAWAGCTIDPQALLNNLGFEKGLPNIVNDALMYRSWTPNDTPGSSKDSGTSEPNSDISEGAALEIDVSWQTFDPDILLDLDKTSLDGELGSLDPSQLLLDFNPGPPPDWDDVSIDFSKPFQLDMSHYAVGF